MYIQGIKPQPVIWLFAYLIQFNSHSDSHYYPTTAIKANPYRVEIIFQLPDNKACLAAVYL